MGIRQFLAVTIKNIYKMKLCVLDKNIFTTCYKTFLFMHKLFRNYKELQPH
jgi:hypothetical protein